MNTVDNLALNIPKVTRKALNRTDQEEEIHWILYTNAGFFVKISENKNVTPNFNL